MLRYLHLALAALLLAISPASAVLVTTDTSVSVPTLPGYSYSCQGSGTWGGASVTLESYTDGAWRTIPDSTFAANFSVVRIAAAKEIRAVITNTSGTTSLSVTFAETRDGDVAAISSTLESTFDGLYQKPGLQVPKENLSSAILVHDDMSGNNATYAASATRTVEPGPGTFTAATVPSTSTVRYENGALYLTPMPYGSGQVFVHWGAQTAAAGLTMIAYIEPAWRQGFSGQSRVGFSHASTFTGPRRGNINILSETPFLTGSIWGSSLTTSTDDGETFLGAGCFEPGEPMGIAIHYKTLSHQQYYVQGGRFASWGCTLGSDNWYLIGETFTAISGTVYPMASNQFSGTMKVLGVKVLSSWAPSERNKVFGAVRGSVGVHIPSFARDPQTDQVILGFNSGAAHTGANIAAIKYTTRLANGTWTTVSDLIATPADGSGQSIQSISKIGNQLWLIYWKHASGLDGGTLYRRTLTLHPTTGAATLGSEVLLGITGTRNLSFSPILTLTSGRLLLVYHKADSSPANNSFAAYSDDGGTTWTQAVIAASMPGGTTWLAEPTAIEESDGGVGVMFRTTANVAYYARCADPDAVTLSWTTPSAVTSIPQPGANGSRMQFSKLSNGEILLIGNNHKSFRRKLTIWRMGDSAIVKEAVPITDFNPIYQTDISTGNMQYPVMLDDGEDLLIAFSHQPGGGVYQLSQIAVAARRWTQPVATEVGGTGLKTLARPRIGRNVIQVNPLTFSVAPVPDMSLGNIFDLRLTASSATVGVPLNPMPGEVLTLMVTQAGSGSYTLAFNAVFEMNGITPTLRTAVNASNIFRFRYNGFTNKWVLESFN